MIQRTPGQSRPRDNGRTDVRVRYERGEHGLLYVTAMAFHHPHTRATQVRAVACAQGAFA